ncbi:hypothetical protein KUV31_06880 [Qipengyuania aquimaris]|uniref:Uncharacterized protein n=1 Tax=Qipengyuania aquimaris TaxID=255984 RepID=A0A9Q3XDP2_9SPHN|nr:hypothetical protein [Qipengyuania aquimaris]
MTDKLDLAIATSDGILATVVKKPQLLRDNGPSGITGEVAQSIEAINSSRV